MREVTNIKRNQHIRHAQSHVINRITQALNKGNSVAVITAVDLGFWMQEAADGINQAQRGRRGLKQ